MSRLYVYHGKRHDTYYTVDRHNKYINLGHDLGVAGPDADLVVLHEAPIAPVVAAHDGLPLA